MRLVYSKHRSLVIRPGERSKDYIAPPGLLPPSPPVPSVPSAAAAYTAAAAAAAAAAGTGPVSRYRGDPTVNVTGEDYVRQHERILEQFGVHAPRRQQQLSSSFAGVSEWCWLRLPTPSCLPVCLFCLPACLLRAAC